MAEDRFDSREINFRQWLPWTLLFRGFRLAFDYRKLYLAAAGILLMAFGWWLLAVIFINLLRHKPVWPSEYPSAKYHDDNNEAYRAFKADRMRWNIRYEAAGPGVGSVVGGDDGYEDAGDLADSPEEFDKIKITESTGPANPTYEIDGKTFALPRKRFGQLRTWPWFENRGPNPALLVQGRAGNPDESGAAHSVPWPKGGFLDWFIRDQAPVLLEPLVKFLRPVGFLLRSGAGPLNWLYFLLVIVWTVAVWAIIGGAITRIAAVQLCRDERVRIGEAIRFTLARWKSYFFASFFPLATVAGIVLILILFSLGNLIPVFAEFWDGILWVAVLALGFLMAGVLVCMINWPMIHATLSTEGSDSFDAVSRSYTYLITKPWHYLWYALVALTYGAIVVFFVGLMASLMVDLGKFGVGILTNLFGYTSRDPSYLFIYAPTSFGWRELLLQDSPIARGHPGEIQQAIDAYTSQADFHWWNYIGPFLVACWLYLAFLVVIGFGYSYFWSASTIIYLLMRQKVDDTELDEVYLDEEDSEEAYAPSLTPSPASPAPASGTPLQMVDAPTLRTPAPSGTPSPPGDGNPPKEPDSA
jgi:hypothetical protein